MAPSIKVRVTKRATVISLQIKLAFICEVDHLNLTTSTHCILVTNTNVPPRIVDYTSRAA